MLIEAAKQITRISEKNDVNSNNYLEALTYIDNLYTFINTLKMVISTKNIVFIPTFKGRLTCEKFGMSSVDVENEMKLFIIKSDLFLEDNELRKKIRESLFPISRSIIFDKDTIEIILK